MLSKEATPETDIALFQKSSSKCSKTKSNSIKFISNCKCLQRLSMGLKYYHKIIETKMNESTKQKFSEFYCKTYTNFLNDYIHFQKQHTTNEQLIHISNELINELDFKICDLSKCGTLTRHYQQNKKFEETKIDIDDRFSFYCNCYDRLHYQFFHLFEMGLRIKPIEIDQQLSQNDDYACTSDKAFEQRRDLIKIRKNSRLNVQRYNDPDNKYNLHMHIASVNDMQHEENNTFLDELYLFIERNEEHGKHQVTHLRQYIIENEYDTDSTKDDLENFTASKNVATSNIAKNIELIRKHVINSSLSVNLFSTGFIFFYDDRVKDSKEKEAGDWLHGYSRSDLFVAPYYDSLKQEVLESKLITLYQWQQRIILKAMEYHKTKKGKKIPLAFMYCIILYCD
eukprot:201695_1